MATPGDGEVTLAWPDPGDTAITRYQYAVLAEGLPFSWTTIRGGKEVTPYVVSSLENGVPHDFFVRAVRGSVTGASTPAEPKGVVPLAAGAPAAPSGMRAVQSAVAADEHGHAHTHTLLTWNDPHDGSITGYEYGLRTQASALSIDWKEVSGSDAFTTGVVLTESTVSLHLYLRAVNANGAGPRARLDNLSIQRPLPPKPTGLRAVAGNGSVTLSWDDPGLHVYLDGYRYTTDSGETWIDIPDSETTAQGQLSRYTVTGLTNGQAYTFNVLAFNGVFQAGGVTVRTAVSEPVTVTPQGGAPAAPAGLAAEPDNRAATLTWDNPQDASITGYQVRQGTAAWADADFSVSDVDGSRSHTVSGLSNGAPVTFRIRAVNDYDGDNTDNPGPASAPVTVTPGVPAAPANLTTAAGNGEVTLTWEPPASDGGSPVAFYRYTANADAATPDWTMVRDATDSDADLADKAEYIVDGLDNNTTYAFAVRAENANGPGVATPTVRATPVDPGAPPRPPAFTATAGTERVRLSWVAPINASLVLTAYEYRQSADGGDTWSPNWTRIADSGPATTEYLVTDLTNDTTYTFELRALKDGAAGASGTTGPTARAQATPFAATAEVITPHSSGSLTTPNGSTYGVVQFFLPEGLNWRIIVPGTTDIDGRSFTLRSLQGGTPETDSDSRYAFTATGQEGLDIVVNPPLDGPVQICLEPSEALRQQVGSRPLRLLRWDGMEWIELQHPTDENGMVCGTTTAFSGFVLGYAVPAPPQPPTVTPDTGAAGGTAAPAAAAVPVANAAPRSAQALPPQTVEAGETSAPLNLARYFTDPDGDPLRYAAASGDVSVAIADLPRGSSRLVLHGVGAGQAIVTVTASDPWGASASQRLTVTVTATTPTSAVPVVVQRIAPQTVMVGEAGAPLDLAHYFRDPDGDPLDYSAVSYDAGLLAAEVAAGSGLLTLRGVAAGDAGVIVTASDPHGGRASQPVTVTVRANAAPEAAQPLPPRTVLVGAAAEPLDLAPYFHDPDGDPLAYAAVSDDTGVLAAEVAAGGSRLTLRAVAPGDAAVVVTASDPFGARASQAMTVTVRTNAAPEVAQRIPPQSVAAGAATEPLDLAAYFHDPDGDPLAYSAESDDAAVATAAVADGLLTLTGVAAGAAMVTVTARDPHDAAASQTVSVRVRAAAPAWLQAWAARFGRTVSGQVLDGVRQRLRLARRPGFQATLAGHPLGGVGEEALRELDDRQLGAAAAFRRELDALAGLSGEGMGGRVGGLAAQRALTGRDLLTSTAFTLTGGDEAAGGFWGLWGRGVVSHFDGQDGALTLNGEVATGMLGIDRAAGRWLTGVALAMSRGSGGYRAADGSGDVESTLTGLYPWLGYHVTERLSLWAALGYGAGDLTLTPQGEAATTAELSLTMVAAGARSEVLRLPQLGGVTLALETDTRLTRTSTGAAAGLAATDASVWLLRLGLEGSRHIALAGGGALRPSVELGLRHDGGDADTGGGIEVGAGLSFSRPAAGLSLDLAARGLLAHRAPGLQDWGASASLSWDPTPSSERGLSMSLQQSVGAASSGGVNALLARDTMAAPSAGAGFAGASRLQARAGYGLPLGAGRFVATPQLGFGLSDGRHDYTLGWHLGVARHHDLGLTVGLEASRRENPDAGDPEHGVMLQLRLGQ